MARVAFYSKGLSNIRMNAGIINPEKQVLGVSGTTYAYLATPFYLNKYGNKKNKFFLLSDLPSNKKLEGVITAHVENINDAIRYSKRAGADYLVITSTCKELEGREADFGNIKIILWAHNNLVNNMDSYLRKLKNLYRLVCLTEESLRLNRISYKLYKKTIIIPHGIDKRSERMIDPTKKEKVVLYIGALVYPKGFHVLARIWKKILAKEPSVKLYVIGSANLHGIGPENSKWGLAEEEYEKTWRKYLSDDKGKLLESVKFLGIVGKDKFEIMRNAKVCVANPFGESETFCYSAVEPQALGVPVVSADRYSLKNVVRHNETGFLTLSERQLVAQILRLLKDDELNTKMGLAGRRFVEFSFSWKRVCKIWETEVFSAHEKKIMDKPYSRYVLNKIYRFKDNLIKIWMSLKNQYFYINLLKKIKRKLKS
jgi:glycosyltransferase involved in cell wall biosynthesis